MHILMSGSGWLVLVWLGIGLISIISKAGQKRISNQPGQVKTPVRYGYRNHPGAVDNRNNYADENEQTYYYDSHSASTEERYAGQQVNQQWQHRSVSQSGQWDQQKIWQQTQYYADNSMTENEYMAEEEFRQQRNVFRQEVPAEEVHEYVYEYVPEEFGEAGADSTNDQFYRSTEIINALQDEQDIAREKAYRRKSKDAFKEEKKSAPRKLFGGQTSLKKAILLSEVLGSPKSLQ
ncbi:hypothetical protein EII17_01475 [Clostridiales bacterium COT073_COT-073]|nr:hypothetical protein EII17_01475 [Clostridiales bacterium COT073_COT-073]